MTLSKSILSYISEANKFEKWYKNQSRDITSNIIDRIYDTKNTQILRRKDVLFPFVYNDFLQKKVAGMAEYNRNRNRKLKPTVKTATKEQDKTKNEGKKNTNITTTQSTNNAKSTPTKSSFWSNHSGKVTAAGGGLAAAGGLATYLHHRSKNKGIVNKIKNNPGKTAGVGLGALAAGAGVAALIRHLRKKEKK